MCFLLCPHRNYLCFSAKRQEEGSSRAAGEDDADQSLGDEDAESGENKIMFFKKINWRVLLVVYFN